MAEVEKHEKNGLIESGLQTCPLNLLGLGDFRFLLSQICHRKYCKSFSKDPLDGQCGIGLLRLPTAMGLQVSSPLRLLVSPLYLRGEFLRVPAPNSILRDSSWDGAPRILQPNSQQTLTLTNTFSDFPLNPRALRRLIAD